MWVITPRLNGEDYPLGRSLIQVRNTEPGTICVLGRALNLGQEISA